MRIIRSGLLCSGMMLGIGVWFADLAVSQSYYQEYEGKKNNILNFQKPRQCQYPDRKALVERLRQLGGGSNVINQKVWRQLSGSEKLIVSQDFIFATMPHVNRKKFPDVSGECAQYGLVPLSIASRARNGEKVPPLEDSFAFQAAVAEIASRRICEGSTLTYQDAPYRSFFYSKSTFPQIGGYLQGALDAYFQDRAAYARKANESRFPCPGSSESAQALPQLDPILDASLGCSTHTDGATLLFDRSYLIRLMSYISENRDPFGGVVFGCWPGWQ